ncbi:MAG: transglycosylase domain-containing protein [Candidatus Nomurabacteria bacterium]|nr:MAG: transglycosylase domain-containing protein [Candidatus Nomurabacteria bacterium]
MERNTAYEKWGLKVAKKRGTRKLNVYANLSRARKTKKDAIHRKKAEYLATLPKHPIKRFFARMHPKRVAGYWFSRKGGKMILKIMGTGVLLVAILVGGLFAYFRKDLDSIRPEELSKRVHTTVTKYLDRNGKLLWEDKGDGNYKLVVAGNEISTLMKEATVAIEDKDFYKHGGVSFTGITRAMINNYTGGSTQGGSTLTQQLVKQVFFASEAQQRGLAGVPRKIKEIILSIEVERMYNKDQILNLYLNESPYGGRRNGVESAAKTYFGIDAKNLNLAQSALLAAIPNEPGLYDPYNPAGQKPLIERQHKVLDEMVSQGYITKDQAAKAKAEPILDTILPQASQFADIKAPHFVQMVRSELEAELGKATVGQGGLVVTTTLDLKVQAKLEHSFKEMFNGISPRYGVNLPTYAGFNNGAATVEDSKTGQIIAMMGSRDYNYPGFGQTNAATSYIQPGSTIKPLVYSALFAKHDNDLLNIYGSGTVLSDTRTTFPVNYTPHDADNRFLGNIPIRNSLALSRNIPAIKAMQLTGVKQTLDLIHAAGDTPYCTQGAEKQVGLAAAIGGCGTKQIDHVNAFSTLARGGVYKPWSTILEVKNSDGDVLKKWSDDQSKRVIDPQVAYIVADMLSDDHARAGLYGTNFPGIVVDNGKVKTATKTGTSDVDGKSKDIWMMSYSPALTMGVWLGNNDPKPLLNGNSSLPGAIINEVMAYAHEVVYAKEGKWKPGEWYSKPKGIQQIGKELYPSWYNQKNAQRYTKLTFDKVSQKLATDCTPAAAKIEQDVLKTIDPTTKKVVYLSPSGFDASENDDAHKCDDAKPSITAIDVSPSGNVYTISVTVAAGKGKPNGLTISVNGKKINSQTISAAGSYEASYTSDSTDPFTISASVTDDLYYSDTKSSPYTPVIP